MTKSQSACAYAGLSGTHFVWLLVCLGVVLAVYFPTFWGEWIYDDLPVIVKNPDIQSFSNFLKDTYPGRPLRELTYLLDYQFFGLEPWGYRIQNILWHGLNAWLLLLLLRALGASGVLTWGGALFFALHPLAVEVVAQTSHRKDSLALCFALLSLLFYIRGSKSQRQPLWLLAAGIAAVVSLQAKQVAYGIPILWAIYEYGWVAKERRLLWRFARLGLWIIPPVVAFGGLWWWFYGGGAEFYFTKAQVHLAASLGVYLPPGNYELYLLMVLKSWAFMGLRLIWPLNLAVQYKYPPPEGWGDPYVVAAIVFLLLLVAVLIWGYRKNPLVLLGGALFCLFWLPASGLLPLSYLSADRYMYAPLAGLAICLAGGLCALRLNPKMLLPPLGIVLLLFGWLAHQQVKTWENEETLWGQSLKVSPTSTYALNNLGAFLIKKQRPAEAVPYLERATKNFDNPLPFYNLGRAYELSGRYQEAAKAYKSFLAYRKPEHMREYEIIRQRFRQFYGIGI